METLIQFIEPTDTVKDIVLKYLQKNATIPSVDGRFVPSPILVRTIENLSDEIMAIESMTEEELDFAAREENIKADNRRLNGLGNGTKKQMAAIETIKKLQSSNADLPVIKEMIGQLEAFVLQCELNLDFDPSHKITSNQWKRKRLNSLKLRLRESNLDYTRELEKAKHYNAIIDSL